jgi:hypothetical protein
MRLTGNDRSLASQAAAYMDAEGDRADEHDNKVSEIEADCLAGKGTDHLDFEDTIYEQRNAISKILVEYNLMKRPADECAKELIELIELLSKLHIEAVEKAAEHQIIWSH